MSRRGVRLSQEQVNEQLVELGIAFTPDERSVPGGLQFASLRAPCALGIYFLEGSHPLPSQVLDSLVLVSNDHGVPDDGNSYLRVASPQEAFYRLMIKNFPTVANIGVHPTAIVDAAVPVNSYIGPYCIVEAGVELGAGCRLDSHVVVKSGSVLGERVRIEPHCTIGATGVAWLWDSAGNERLIQPQTGGVRIGNDVFIGSDVAIVRGSVNEETSIGDGTVIAHGSKIGHGCRIGKQCHLANNVSLAGNVDAGDRAFFGSGVVVRPQVRIADDVIVGAGSVVIDHVRDAGAVVYGVPARCSKSLKGHYTGVPTARKKMERQP